MRSRIFTRHELSLLLDCVNGELLSKRERKQVRTLRYRARKYYEDLKFHFSLVEKLRAGEIKSARFSI